MDELEDEDDDDDEEDDEDSHIWTSHSHAGKQSGVTQYHDLQLPFVTLHMHVPSHVGCSSWYSV